MTYGFVATLGLVAAEAVGLAQDAAITSVATRQRPMAIMMHLRYEETAHDHGIALKESEARRELNAPLPVLLLMGQQHDHRAAVRVDAESVLCLVCVEVAIFEQGQKGQRAEWSAAADGL